MKWFTKLKHKMKRLVMSKEIVIELDDETVEALKLEYGELLGVENLVQEIVLNDLKHRGELKSMIEETRLANIGTAKLNSLLGQYEQRIKHVLGVLPQPEQEAEILTVNASDSVQIEDSVSSEQPVTAVTVGMDVQKQAPNSTAKSKTPVTNQLLDGNAKLDPAVQKVMDEVRARNKTGSDQAKTRKGATTAHTGGIVASS